MIRVETITLNEGMHTAKVSLLADSREEVTNDAAIVGFPEGYTIDFGSTVMTTAMEIAVMKSDGQWNWV